MGMTTKELHPRYNVTLHQLTTPRTMQAFLVVLFGLTIVIMTGFGRPVPDIVSYGLAAILGFYFKDSGDMLPTINGIVPNGASVNRSQRLIDAELALDADAYAALRDDRGGESSTWRRASDGRQASSGAERHEYDG